MRRCRYIEADYRQTRSNAQPLCNSWASCSIHFPVIHSVVLLSASLYVSKRGAYWDRLCRDVVGRWSLWLVGRLVVGWLVVTRVHCGQTVHPRPIVTNGTLIGNPTPGIQWYNFRPPGVTPNRGMGPPWGAFCQITLTSCYHTFPQRSYTIRSYLLLSFYISK